MKSAVETKELVFNSLILKIMKKLNKFILSSKKSLNNQELLRLKGGVNCFCFYDSGLQHRCGTTGVAGSSDDCNYMCEVQDCSFHMFTGF